MTKIAIATVHKKLGRSTDDNYLFQSMKKVNVFDQCYFSGGGLPRKLECHGFVCKSQDDAISVAAQLYQGLLDAIRRHGSKVSKEGDVNNILLCEA